MEYKNEYLSVLDFNCVGNIAMHCDIPKLCIAIDESKHFDLIPLFCFDFLNDVFANWNSEDAKYRGLIDGATFVSCGGKTDYHHGIKRVWVYYAYARYLLINRMNDTPNGLVSKTNDFSIPIQHDEITGFSNKYRAMGREAFESVRRYLCHNKEDYPKFNASDCDSCNCSSCHGGETKKMTGIKYSVVRK